MKKDGYIQQHKTTKRIIAKTNYNTECKLKDCVGTHCKCGVHFNYEYNTIKYYT